MLLPTADDVASKRRTMQDRTRLSSVVAFNESTTRGIAQSTAPAVPVLSPPFQPPSVTSHSTSVPLAQCPSTSPAQDPNAAASRKRPHEDNADGGSRPPIQQRIDHLIGHDQVGPRRIAVAIPAAEDEPHDEVMDEEALQMMEGEAVGLAAPVPKAIGRLAIAGKSRRAEHGIQPWARGSGRPDVNVDHVRLAEPKLRALDGSTTVTTESGKRIKYAPIMHGTTVLEFGKGAGKTWRTIEFFLSLSVTKAVFVTPRRNLAMKLSTDLQKRGISHRNYLKIEDDSGDPLEISVAEWCDFDVVIISAEQVHKLNEQGEGFERYRGGLFFIDEPVTLCASLGGETIKWPEDTLTAMSHLSRVCTYTILTDADVSVDGRLEPFIRAIAPTRDVLHIQSTLPAMERTLFVGFKVTMSKWRASMLGRSSHCTAHASRGQ